jgi:hypothetical protein
MFRRSRQRDKCVHSSLHAVTHARPKPHTLHPSMCSLTARLAHTGTHAHKFACRPRQKGGNSCVRHRGFGSTLTRQQQQGTPRAAASGTHAGCLAAAVSCAQPGPDAPRAGTRLARVPRFVLARQCLLQPMRPSATSPSIDHWSVEAST